MAASSPTRVAPDLAHLRGLGIDLLARGEVAAHERLRARQVALGVLQLHLIGGFLGLGLGQDGGVGARVDQRQRVAALDVLALGEEHLLQRAVDARAHHHRLERLHRADVAQQDRHVLADDRATVTGTAGPPPDGTGWANAAGGNARSPATSRAQAWRSASRPARAGLTA